MVLIMGKIIAIIDDDQILLEILATVLEEEGYVVKKFSHTVFIDVLEKENYDVLLLDVWFDTYRAGIEMAQAIHNRASLMNKPVVMLSSDPNLQEYARKAGVKNYLSKPIDFDALLEVVNALLDTEKVKHFSRATVTYNQNRGQI